MVSRYPPALHLAPHIGRWCPIPAEHHLQADTIPGPFQAFLMVPSGHRLLGGVVSDKTCSCVHCCGISFAQWVPWSEKIFHLFTNYSHSGGKGMKVLLIWAFGVNAGSVSKS